MADTPGYCGHFHLLPFRTATEWLVLLTASKICLLSGDGREEQEQKRVGDAAAVPAFIKVLKRRYGDGDTTLLLDRIEAYFTVVQASLRNTGAKFDADSPVVLIASPGRDRLFMGHTDFAGLGGFTVDAATSNEIIAVMQLHQRPVSKKEESAGMGRLYLHNFHADAFPDGAVSIADLAAIAADPSQFGKQCFDPQDWFSYIKGALTYMLSPSFTHSQELQCHLGVSHVGGSVSDVYMVVGSVGKLALPSSGGVSSSASLTGAFGIGLCALFQMNVSADELATVDYGEYYLGKFAGAADKMAQLHADKGTVVVVGSLPERLVTKLTFPSRLHTLMVDIPIPRLTVAVGKEWLFTRPGVSEDHAQAAFSWALSVMQRFGSKVFVLGAEMLCTRLQEKAWCDYARISVEEAGWLLQALTTDDATATTQEDETTRASPSEEKAGGDGEEEKTPTKVTKPLLRRLCSGSVLETLTPTLKNKRARCNLLLRMLKILPELEKTADCPYPYAVRKAVLYALSEMERGVFYLETLHRLCTGTAIKGQSASASGSSSSVSGATVQEKKEEDTLIAAILQQVRLAHDGDRAVVDYRHLDDKSFAGRNAKEASRYPWEQFKPTSWAFNANSQVSDAALDQFVHEERTLDACVGGFERSLAEIDEMADAIDKVFYQRAAMRVAAAGLGGKVCVHCFDDVTDDVVAYLEEREWKTRRIKPGSGTQVLAWGS